MMTALLMAASILVLGETGTDTFSGHLDGRELVVRMDGSGVLCRGDLVEIAPGMGQGVLDCSDHRHGTFHYKLEGGTGEAYGRLEGKGLVLTFG